MNGYAGLGQNIVVVEPACLCAVSIYPCDEALGQKAGNIRRYYIPDGGVGGADDITACDDVPDGDAMG